MSTLEVTTTDEMYNAGVNDTATEIITGAIVYTGITGRDLTGDEALAYMDGRTWAWNHREEVELP